MININILLHNFMKRICISNQYLYCCITKLHSLKKKKHFLFGMLKVISLNSHLPWANGREIFAINPRTEMFLVPARDRITRKLFGLSIRRWEGIFNNIDLIQKNTQTLSLIAIF